MAVKERTIFAVRLAQARQRVGLTQAELGRRAGLDPTVASPRINQYEKGLHVPHLSTAKRLAKVLGIPTALLFTEDEALAKLLLLWANANTSQRRKLVKEAESLLAPRKGADRGGAT